ncbi:MAG: D-alanyl-D-alanine carboxypeptidase [Alphaproteobacteria bacterium]|nr:D-alanyl-D-alanine carboxypeptidase [Alphaproteobacteria bacterium]
MKSKLALILAFVFFGMPLAQAQTAPPLDVAARQVFLVDVATDTPLYEKDADTKMPTSSMSKMMTMYLVFDALKNGTLKMDEQLPVSEHAWKQEGSRMFVKVGDKVKVEDLIRGVIVQSGNDAAVCLAEALGSGSESAFADMMNAKAKELGMTNSHFMNATGLPDPQHYSTARDLATLAMALQRDFPEYYHYFSELTFTYNNITQGNRNPLLYRNMNVDGLKTGHTDVGGYGLTVSTVRDGRRLVAVLNGMDSMQSRADEPAKVLDYGYREFGLYPIVKAGDVMASPAVWLGRSKNVPIVATQSVLVTLPRAARNGLKAEVSFDQPIPAPIKKGQQIGELTITAPGLETKVIPLAATEDVGQVGFFARVFDKLGVIFGGKKG